MERARQSSGIYEVNHGSTHSFSSAASLRGFAFDVSVRSIFDLVPTGHAAAPAGYQTTTNSGVPVAPTVIPSGGVSGWEDQPTPAVAPVSPPIPFYKKRWFIISQIILIPLAIALIFILLFPVVRAIVQLVVKRTNLDVTLASLTQPTNNS